METEIKVLKVIARDQCIGCLSCMYACSRLLRRNAGSAKAAIRVASYVGVEGSFSIRVCARCEAPDCVKACPTGAIKTSDGGGVRLVKKDSCTSCKSCIKACVLHALQWDEEAAYPIPCIQCGQCVKYCPNGVIRIESLKRESGANKE
jgi:Fe-S-cluster-containing dehydrogenase component